MRSLTWKSLFWMVLAAVLVIAGGCQKSEKKAGPADLASEAEVGRTVGSLAELVKPAPAAVEGYGLVGGLPGTGSAYCPPQLRNYLKQYILAQLPTERVNLDELINSKDTAVVALEAMLPATPSVDEHFDVRVSLIPGSEATSIGGGWLYKAELVPRGTFGVDTPPLATVDGSVFIDSIGTGEPDLRNGYILGGGRALYEYAAILRLRRPNYPMASAIRNRLSERYGANVARAISARDVEVQIPPEYRYRKQRFLAMVLATHLEVTDELTKARVSTRVQQLTAGPNREDAEVALESMGRESLNLLAQLLSASDAEVRLRAARCMLGLRDDRGLGTLRELALDVKSPYRREALDAVMVSAKRNDAAALARRLLRDSDTTMVLAAYEHLRRIDDPVVMRELVGRSFHLEQIVQTNHRAVFVSRSGDPRVVLFGAPLECTNNLFVESPDQTIVIDSREHQDYVSLTRKHPTRPGIMGPVRTDFAISNLIRTLGNEAATTSQGQLRGLSVPYAEVIAVLEQLVAKGATGIEFWPGPLAKISLPVKK